MYALVEYKDWENGIIELYNHIGILKKVGIERGMVIENNKKYVEPIFRVCLNSQIPRLKSDIPTSMIVAYIGKNKNIFNDRSYYILNEHRFIKKRTFDTYINTFILQEDITSIDYIICITDLIYEALKDNKELIIYSDIYIPEEQYRYRSLTNKVINSLLKSANGILIQRVADNIEKYYRASQDKFEFYIEDTIYTGDKFEEAVSKLIELINTGYKREELKREYRRI